MDDKKKREIEEAYQKRWGNNNFEKKQTLQDLTKVYEELQSSISSAIGNDKQSENLRIQEFMTSQKLADSLVKESLSLNIPTLQDILKSNIELKKDFLENKDYMKSANAAINFTKEVNNDIYKYKMDGVNKREKQFHDIEYAKPIESRNYANEMLEEFKIQNEKLNIVIEKLDIHNDSTERQIAQDKASSIEQIKKLQDQIDDNNKSSWIVIIITLVIAVVSIIFSWKTTEISANKTDEIYKLENNSSDIQHNELKLILKENTNKTLNLDIEQLNVLNKILQSLNEKKITK